MPFGITVAGDMFQCKLDKCFGHIKNLIVIADDIMVTGRKHNHKDHDLAFTTLLQMARKCNVKLNYKVRMKDKVIIIITKCVNIVQKNVDTVYRPLISFF